TEWVLLYGEQPVVRAHRGEQRHETEDLEDAPVGIGAALARDIAVYPLRIVAEKAEKGVLPDVLGVPHVPVLVDAQRVDGTALLIRQIGVAHVMLHVDAAVERLPEPAHN